MPFWEIRSTKDDPSLRVLGLFPLADVFVSTNYAEAGYPRWMARSGLEGSQTNSESSLANYLSPLTILSQRSTYEMCVPEPVMKSSTRNEPKTTRDIAYYRQRHRNRVFSKLVSFILEQAERNRLTKKDIAERLNKAQVKFLGSLNRPGNLTLDTISDLLLAFDA